MMRSKIKLFLFSAVDVDIAICMAEHADQIEDVQGVMRRMKRSEGAASLSSSTHYAAARIILAHAPSKIKEIFDNTVCSSSSHGSPFLILYPLVVFTVE